MTEGFSLVNLKGISEPLTKLIDSVSKGIGTLYEPAGKIRNAKAEAKAMLILAEANEQVEAIALRALQRVNHKEIRRQKNIDSIVKGAVEFLPEKVSKQEVDEDWIVNFFDLGQDIGNTEMQKIWSKLLAGEVAKPGRFKPRTIQAVKSLSVEDANLFTHLCEFSFSINSGNWILPIFGDDFYKYIRSHGLTTNAEMHLKNIGLLSAGKIWYGGKGKGSNINLKYFSEDFYSSPKSAKEKESPVFMEAFTFTEIGKELASIAGGKPDSEYIKLLCGKEYIHPLTDNGRA